MHRILDKHAGLVSRWRYTASRGMLRFGFFTDSTHRTYPGGALLALENQPHTIDALRARLRWRCRRGVRELDLLLSGFMEHGYTKLHDRERLVFERLLDQPDDVLLELLMGRTLSTDKALADVIAKIQGAAANNA